MARTSTEKPSRPNVIESSCTELVGEDDDRITLVGLIFEIGFGLRRSLLRGIDEALGISGQSFEILLRLVRSPKGQLRMSDLAAQTGLSPSGLTRAIDRLSRAGFLERESCSDDRRGAYAVLSEQGRRRTEVALARHRADIDGLIDGVFSATEETNLVAYLRQLRDRVQPDAARRTDDDGPAPSHD